jgi:hypothetical protein
MAIYIKIKSINKSSTLAASDVIAWMKLRSFIDSTEQSND